MAKVDFGRIKEAALSEIHRLVAEWLPDGRREGNEWVARNPNRHDEGLGSFKVNTSTGVWADFATNDRGGDPISLLAYINNCSQLDAAKDLARQLGIDTGEDAPPSSRPSAPARRDPPPSESAPPEPASDGWNAVLPVPANAPPPRESHHRHGKPSKRWAYRDAQGRVLCWVLRFEGKGKGARKNILPLTYCEKDGERAWRWKGLPKPRPLYNLDELAKRPDAPVIVCEGEKAADAAAALFPSWVATTSLNGSKAENRTDWSPLTGRRVIFWRDYDEVGATYMHNVSRLLEEYAASMEEIRLPLAGTPLAGGEIDPQSGVPADGWDAADARDDGWTAAHMVTLEKAGALLKPYERARRGKGQHGAVVLPDQLHRVGERAAVLMRDGTEPHPETGQPWPPIYGNWTVSNDGVQEPGVPGGRAGPLVCLHPVWVRACTYQPIGTRVSWGVHIQFYDLSWRLRSHAFPMRRLSEQGGVLGQELLDMGLLVVSGKEKMLCRYLLVQSHAAPHIRATSKLGWLDDDGDGPRMFVLPDQVIGDSEEIIYQPDAPNMEYLAATLHAHGTLDDWRDRVARRCEGNPMLMFFLLVGLAPPLMRFTDTASGGFHLAGGSTTGKTTALQVAVTAWGCGADPQSGPQHTAIRRWKATGNAIESIAEMHNHMLLALDEINEVDPRELGGIIYQLAGGQSKGRATLHGGLRAPRHWQLLYVSSGERGVRDILRQAGQTLQGGQQVRLPEIPAEDPVSGRNAVIERTGDLEPAEFAEQLKQACARCYGTAGPVLVAYLIMRVAELGQHRFVGQLRQELQGIEAKLIERIEGAGERLSDENRRALRQFALVALAGAHAAEAGIVPWSFEASFEAVEIVVLRWVRDQGTERTEIERGLVHLRDQLIARTTQIVNVTAEIDKVHAQNIIGFHNESHIMLLPSAFRTLVNEYDNVSILRALDKRGLLETNKGRLTKRAPPLRALDGGRPPLYWIAWKFLDDDDDGDGPRPMRQQALDQEIPF
ncbi:MAG: DUF927 domain-containing protein [Gammaproteobacteria bacterium]